MTIAIATFLITLILTHEPQSLLEKRFSKAEVKSDGPLTNIVKNLQEILKPLSKKNIQSSNYIGKTKKLLLQSGHASTEDDVVKFDTQRITYLLFVGVICLFLFVIELSTTTMCVAVLLLYLAYKLPEYKLQREIKRRQSEFMKYLPDAVDLLTICVQAGLGLDASFEKVAEEFRLTSEVVSTEFSRLNKDILSGLNREDAYKNLILRNENQDLQSFVALLIQTDRLGTSITQSLGAFCDTMRTRKRQRIEELSQMASTKMTVPMVLFMLPAIFIIIMYPAFQKIMQNLGH